MVPYKPAANIKTLANDAIIQVFFSLGLCVGIQFAYGSYNRIKQRVIAYSYLITLMDLLFGLLSGFVTWGALGFLYANSSALSNESNFD